MNKQPGFKRSIRKVALEAEQAGFYHQMKRHVGVFFRRSNRLVVTFDNLNSRDQPSPRYPWAFDFVRDLDASHLAVMMIRRNDWFRHPDVADFFDVLREESFFSSFSEVIFYGSSMGGYGALAYCSAAPGSRVVAVTPQTSLDPTLVPWEERFPSGVERGDWAGRYLDGATEAQSASSVTVFVDPYYAPDRRHVDRLDPSNLAVMPCNWSQHKAGRTLSLMGNIKDVMSQAVLGTLTIPAFRQAYRQGRSNQFYARKILKQGMVRHPMLASNALDSLSVTHPEWKFPQIRAALKARLTASSP